VPRLRASLLLTGLAHALLMLVARLASATLFLLLAATSAATAGAGASLGATRSRAAPL